MVLINASQKNPWDHELQASSRVCLRGGWTLNTVALFILIPYQLLHAKPRTSSGLNYHKGFAMGQINGPFPSLQSVWSALFFLYTFHTDTFPTSQESLLIINYLCNFWQSIVLCSKSLMKATHIGGWWHSSYPLFRAPQNTGQIMDNSQENPGSATHSLWSWTIYLNFLSLSSFENYLFGRIIKFRR